MSWMEGIENYIIYKCDEERAKNAVEKADVIFCMDFNTTQRLETLGEVIDENKTAKRVLIDHHLNPASDFDATFSYPEESSACFVTLSLIEAFVGAEMIDNTTADLLYLGMMTDTGSFAFGKLSPELFRGVATLVERGANIADINVKVYNSYSADRARLFGYVVNRKMEIIEEGRVGFMSLTEREMRRHNFQQGDSEGFVNYPLSITSVKIAALFIQQRKFIRVSLRSRGRVDVNLFARRYFNGGGHKNAAGGKSTLSIEETIEKFKSAVSEFIAEGGID